MDARVERWRKSGAYLPAFMRDFHDQKDVFKTLHESVNVEGHTYAKAVDWVTGQCYVIDIFLWFMARHGYVLRKADAKMPFDNLQESLSAAKEARDQRHAAVFHGANLPDAGV